ncbi:rhodanese-like domain-containing protein [Actinoplanes sp. NBRC 101535]|uniref:rhodanese-like domain-containing protein n=1 Tax=Actinoplanes sp. NBRC 101535 TaxID=3032196 RepID=UPI002554BF24|nr:rhodanese-like domain-containing protein [Actinoplanes sp. NBRC 101535]
MLSTAMRAGLFAVGHIPGGVNVPLDELRDRMAGLPGGDLAVCCQVGQRGHRGRVARRPRPARSNLDGGYLTWEAGLRSGC